jgi:hypothetical protein
MRLRSDSRFLASSSVSWLPVTMPAMVPSNIFFGRSPGLQSQLTRFAAVLTRRYTARQKQKLRLDSRQSTCC